ncbi:MAG: hypothetical protein LBR94_09530 [Desulfovibrio sp.]|jgi:carbon starvation protein CstA|nr:hypothetical protein [Desulfovibrio sp.]
MPHIFYFFLAVLVLILGYIAYGRIVERIFRIDKNRKTPALTMTDGVDYMPMPMPKLFLIHFLNISGIGPVFCPILVGVVFVNTPAALLAEITACTGATLALGLFLFRLPVFRRDVLLEIVAPGEA